MSAIYTLTMLLAGGGLLDLPVGQEAPDEAAAEGAPQPVEETGEGQSLDDELFRSLGGEDEAGEEAVPTQDAPDGAAADEADDAAMPAAEDLDDELFGDLDQGEDLGDEAENPLVRLGARMRQVEELIAARRSGPGTQRMQREIADELAKLIERARQQQQQQQQQASQAQRQQTSQRQQVRQPQPRQSSRPSQQPATEPSRQPAEDSSEQMRPDELDAVDMAHMNGLMKRIWGQLPDKDQREQMLQMSIEQFLPKYSESIEQYFQRLAEQGER